MRFAFVFRFSCGPRSIFLAGKRNTSGERYTSGRRDLSRTSSRSNVTRNVTSTSNVTVHKRFTTGARRCLECEKIHDVDEQDVYRMCIGGSTRVPDVHRRVKIRCGADPRAVHDREPDVDRLHPCAVSGRVIGDLVGISLVCLRGMTI